MARHNLARVTKGAATTTPELLSRRLISAKAAGKLLGVSSRPSRLAALGLVAIEETHQSTTQGPLTFRAYDADAVARVKHDLYLQARETAAAAARLKAARSKGLVDPVNPFFLDRGDRSDQTDRSDPTDPTDQPERPSRPPTPPAPGLPPPDPTPRQTLAILCEIRDLLKRQQKTA